MSFNTISVVGLGYIGLPTAAMFASRKKQVIGVDINKHVVDTVNLGDIHIVEPGLNIMVKDAVAGGFLRATTTPEPADVFLIAVPTPFLPQESVSSIPEPDLSYIEAASKAIAKVLKKGDLVILESTSPVGTTEKMATWLAEKRGDLTFPQTHGDDSDIRVAHCPERVMPGYVIRELVENDRVIGGMTKSCSTAAIEVYKLFVEGDCLVTNTRTAEMVKLTENASRDVNVAFANELSIICDRLEIDVWELIELANHHPRVNILQPGPGVGGHCIAIDPWFIVSKTPMQAQLIHTARKINNAKPDWVVDKIKIAISEFSKANPRRRLEDISVACYGLTFKSDIDDLRESPAMYVMQQLAKVHKGRVVAVEPNINQLKEIHEKVKLVTFDEAKNNSDVHLLLVDHKAFKLDKILGEYVVDTKGIW